MIWWHSRPRLYGSCPVIKPRNHHRFRRALWPVRLGFSNCKVVSIPWQYEGKYARSRAVPHFRVQQQRFARASHLALLHAACSSLTHWELWNSNLRQGVLSRPGVPHNVVCGCSQIMDCFGCGIRKIGFPLFIFVCKVFRIVKICMVRELQ